MLDVVGVGGVGKVEGLRLVDRERAREMDELVVRPSSPPSSLYTVTVKRWRWSKLWRATSFTPLTSISALFSAHIVTRSHRLTRDVIDRTRLLRVVCKRQGVHMRHSE